MKTKTAWLTFGKHGKVTATSNGVKDPWGKEVWTDKDGNCYELAYARLGGVWAFLPRTRDALEHWTEYQEQKAAR